MKDEGYTLLEIMIALTIFAILALITSSVIARLTETEKSLAQHAKHLAEIQFAIALIEQDLNNTTNRTAINQIMFPAFIGSIKNMEFTRDGIANPDGEAHQSSLQRVAFACENHNLIRRYRYALDTPVIEPWQEEILLDNLKSCKLQYLDRKREVIDNWLDNNQQLPIAVKLALVINNARAENIDLLFIIPEAM